MYSLLRFILLAVSASSQFMAETTARSAASDKLIFILAGQSNMAGRGGVVNDTWDHVVPPECAPNPSILRLTATIQWVEAHEPLHADIDVHKICGVGPGMAFSNAVRSGIGGGVVIGLVPCAIGGTAISEWMRGTWLYESMLRRTKAAVEKGGGTVGAVLWYQGESDTVNRSDAEKYGRRMVRLIRNLRADLGMPELLVIQVALASGEGNFMEMVRKAQKGINLPNVLCVDAKGLPLEEDQLHLTTQAQVNLGKMFAAAYLEHAKSHAGCGILTTSSCLAEA